MDKQAHGKRLALAMARHGLDRQVVADATGVKVRTITNWTTGATMPSDREREALRRLLPGYDDPGDQVEIAVRASGLVEWRQSTVIGFYQMHVNEQQREMGA